MPLNPSGPLSLGGSVVGESVALEIKKPATATISLNDPDVRKLANILSGTISLPKDFWGKSSSNFQAMFYAGGQDGNNNSNQAIRINKDGGLIGPITYLGTARRGPAGAGNTDIGMFYGSTTPNVTSAVTRIDGKTGLQVGGETSLSIGSGDAGGCTVGPSSSPRAMYIYTTTNTSGSINSCMQADFNGQQYGGTPAIGTNRHGAGGARIGEIGMFYAGQSAWNGSKFNTVTRINNSPAQVGGETSVGTARSFLAGCALEGMGIYFGGMDGGGGYSNVVTRVNADGNLIGSQTNVGGGARGAAGGRAENIAVFYGSSGGYPGIGNELRRADANGNQVGSSSSVGAGVVWPGGATFGGV